MSTARRRSWHRAQYEWKHESTRPRVALDDLVIYELHVGTFTQEGTFLAAIDKLDALKELGVTAIELMPLADFPGPWNWGYDGVMLYAPARAPTANPTISARSSTPPTRGVWP